jgi:hypothetical protein
MMILTSQAFSLLVGSGYWCRKGLKLRIFTLKIKTVGGKEKKRHGNSTRDHLDKYNAEGNAQE